MMRFSSQLIFCSPDNILHRTVIEQDENRTIQRLISLDEMQVEPANTFFFDGIISAEIISLKQNLNQNKKNQISADYQYFDLQKSVFNSTEMQPGVKTIFDFGTSNVIEINKIISKNTIEFSKLNVFEMIAGCVYYPSILLGKPLTIDKQIKSQLILWQKIDFANNRMTAETNLKFMNGKM